MLSKINALNLYIDKKKKKIQEMGACCAILEFNEVTVVLNE